MAENTIEKTCKNSWSEQFLPGHDNAKNCSGFVKSVAARLRVPLPAG